MQLVQVIMGPILNKLSICFALYFWSLRLSYSFVTSQIIFLFWILNKILYHFDFILCDTIIIKKIKNIFFTMFLKYFEFFNYKSIVLLLRSFQIFVFVFPINLKILCLNLHWKWYCWTLILRLREIKLFNDTVKAKDFYLFS